MVYGLEPICEECNESTILYPDKNKKTYSCVRCAYQFDPLEGTIFEKKKTEFGKIFYVLLMVVATQGNISTKKLAKELKMTYPSTQALKIEIMHALKFKPRKYRK